MGTTGSRQLGWGWQMSASRNVRCEQEAETMPLDQSDMIIVKQTRCKGRGVFAKRFIAAGALIERVPVLVVPTDQLR